MKNHEDSVLLYTERYVLVTIDPHDNESKQRTNEWMHAVARPKIPLGNDYKIGNIGRKIGNMSENNYPTYFSNPL